MERKSPHEDILRKKTDPKNSAEFGVGNSQDKERIEYEANVLKLEEEIRTLEAEIRELDRIELEETRNTKRAQIEDWRARAEALGAKVIARINAENARIIEEKILASKAKIKKEEPRTYPLLKKILDTAKSGLRRKLIKYVLLPVGLATSVAASYHTPEEYYQMFQNWTERHVDKFNEEDPNIVGIDTLYSEPSNVQRTTYDFIGTEKINYKSGYYTTSVFDLTDHTPPHFQIINDREYHTKIEKAAGITTNLFKPFYKFSEFTPKLKGHLDKSDAEKGEISVVGYNPKTQTMRAGSLKEFNDDWMVSETYKIPLNFKLKDGKVPLVYHNQGLRMVPQTTNENGIPVPFPIGITYDQKVTSVDPHEATRFGTLEGGKVIMVCGEKQLQVNGSFADIFRVYERLQKEYPGKPIEAYLLDNGSYNLPIWSNDTDITPQLIKDHMLRNRDGGTALALLNGGAISADGTMLPDDPISPYEYKNKYPEFEHHIEGSTLDKTTGKLAKNEHSVIVIHHTGNYEDPKQIIEEFEDPKNQRSAHVLILKDGTRHMFNNDNYVLAHAGKSDFNDRNAANFFAIGIELEGDSRYPQSKFTLAQLESMLEYIRPRVEKYGIPIENITTHKTIRDNYIRKHPDEKDAAGKPVNRTEDLDDKVWEQIRNLIAKKIYDTKKIGSLVTGDGAKLIGAFAYEEAARATKNPKLALAGTKEILEGFHLQPTEIKRIATWLNSVA